MTLERKIAKNLLEIEAVALRPMIISHGLQVLNHQFTVIIE